MGFIYSEKATKIWRNLYISIEINLQNSLKTSSYFCDILRIVMNFKEMDCFAQTFLLIFCYICYDIFIFYFHKAIIVLCANISQVQPFQTTELSGFGTLSDKKSLQPQLTTEGREYWAEHHCIVGFVRSNFLSGLCMAWTTISYVCPLLFHRLFVCIPHSLAHFWIPRNWLSTVHMPLHLLDFDVSGWLLDRDFSLQRMDQFLEQAHQILEHGSVFKTMDFFWRYVSVFGRMD